MKDGCIKCGGGNFWFDREIMAWCDSMHNVCDNCHATQPCGHPNCLGLEPAERGSDELTLLRQFEAAVRKLERVYGQKSADGYYDDTDILVDLLRAIYAALERLDKGRKG